MTYEEMKLNLMEVLRKTLMFFGKEYSDAEIDNLHSSLSVKEMRSRWSAISETRKQSYLKLTGIKMPDENFE